MVLKRSHDDFEADGAAREDLASVQVTSTAQATEPQPESIAKEDDDEEGWQVAEPRSKRRKKLPRKEGDKYPAISHSHHARLQSLLGLNALQNLVLYLLADGAGPQWCSIKNHANFRKVVVLMVPGLEMGMFDGSIDLASTVPASATDILDGVTDETDSMLKQKGYASPEDYYPSRLDSKNLPASFEPLKDMFTHVWPVKTPGDDRFGKMHSPLASMLTIAVKSDKDDKTGKKGPGPPASAKHWQSQCVPITELLATTSELIDGGYTVHPSHFADKEDDRSSYEKTRMRDGKSSADGWKDSPGTNTLDDGHVKGTDKAQDKTLQGRSVLAIDCEMCITSPLEVQPATFSLTRMSVIDWEGNVVLDELVKPKDPITNYVTAYSGITEKMLENVTTTLEQAQEKLLAKLTPHTILIGHSLESDLNALKITHPFIVDTAFLYPHPRGAPLKSSLKWLAQKYLNRTIQAGHGSTGHDSVEDALASLDLVKQKCEKGKAWGTSDASTESIFHRLGRATRPRRYKRQPDGEDEYRVGAVVDWGDPKRGFGSQAKVAIPCQDDTDVAKGIAAAVNGGSVHDQIPAEGVDFVWGRLRELEAYRQWWQLTKSQDMAELRENALNRTAGRSLGSVLDETVARIDEVWQALPSCTAFIVYSGSGDPRRLSELQDQKQRHKAEYAIKKWDELTVHWTDKEEQELRRACEMARRGIALMGVK